MGGGAGARRQEAIAVRSKQVPVYGQDAAKLQSDKGKAAYRRRKWIAEPPNGWVKNVLGCPQFSLRGLDRVKAEWKLVCLALNLRRRCTWGAA